MFNCRWCSDRYDTLTQLMGHAAWTHKEELTCAVCRPMFSSRPGRVAACAQCLKRDDVIEAGRLRGLRTSELFAVTTYAREHDGHHLYHSALGEIPLCTARRLQLPTYMQQKDA